MKTLDRGRKALSTYIVVVALMGFVMWISYCFFNQQVPNLELILGFGWNYEVVESTSFDTTKKR